MDLVDKSRKFILKCAQYILCLINMLRKRRSKLKSNDFLLYPCRVYASNFLPLARLGFPLSLRSLERFLLDLEVLSWYSS